MMPYWVYVLRSKKTDRRYIGSTDNLKARLERHNSGLVFSTAHCRPWRAIYVERFNTRAEAVQRERFLKSGQGRQFLNKLDVGLNRQSPPEAD